MKTLQQHIEEKLIINKNFKANTLLNDLERFTITKKDKIERGSYVIFSNPNSLIHFDDYVRDNKINEFFSPNVLALRKNDLSSKYFCCINSEISTTYVFNKEEYDTHKVKSENWIPYTLYTFFINDYDNTVFKYEKHTPRFLIFPLIEDSMFNRSNDKELYEISKEMFEEIEDTYKELYNGRLK